MKKTKATAGQRVLELQKKRANRRRVRASEEEMMVEEDMMEDEAAEEAVEELEEDAAAADYMDGEDEEEEASEEGEAADAAEDAEDAVEDLEDAAEDLEEAAEAAADLAEEASEEADDAEEEAEEVSAAMAEEGQMAEAPEPDLGEEDYGVSIPPELADAVAEGAKSMDESNEAALNVQIPPGLDEAVMAVADPAAMGQDAQFDMIPFVSGSTVIEVLHNDAHWMLTANGQPLAEIRLSDQENAEKIAAHFVGEGYARNVLAAIHEQGLEQALDFVKARVYVAKADRDERLAKAKAELEASSKVELRTAIAELKDTYLNTLDQVLAAAANNLFVENELKDALIAGFKAIGNNEATCSQIVDEAFALKGKPTIKAFLDQAEEWSNFAPEARLEVEKMVSASARLPRALPSTRGPAAQNPQFNSNMAQKMEAAAVPVAQAARPLAEPTVLEASADDNSDEAYKARLRGYRSTIND